MECKHVFLIGRRDPHTSTKNLEICHVHFDTCTDTVHVSSKLPRALCYACDVLGLIY
jgi:hypothetical protein